MWKRLAYSRITLFFLVIMLGALCFFVANEYIRWRAVTQRVVELRQETNSVRDDNESLEKRLDYLNSDAYIEYEAKRVLGYKNKQESVVVVPDSVLESNEDIINRGGDILSDESILKSSGMNLKSVSGGLLSFSVDNYNKWFEYFFY